jgi:hypothetical protein
MGFVVGRYGIHEMTGGHDHARQDYAIDEEDQQDEPRMQDMNPRFGVGTSADDE